MEAYVLVKMVFPETHEPVCKTVIGEIIRTYDNLERAAQDLDLLRMYAPTQCSYELIQSELFA